MFINSDPLPKFLYRAFSSKTRASDFVERGRFRMGDMRIYRKIEDQKRQDRTEGAGHYIDTEEIHEHFQLGNHVYLLCCSLPEVDLGYLASTMGRYVVCIASPAQLISDINQFLMSSPYKFRAGVLGKVVKYNKGGKLLESLDEFDRAIFSTYQKLDVFKSQCEFRLIAILNASPSLKYPGDYLDINLNKKLDYADVL